MSNTTQSPRRSTFVPVPPDGGWTQPLPVLSFMGQLAGRVRALFGRRSER